jgi:hypothetical protein
MKTARLTAIVLAALALLYLTSGPQAQASNEIAKRENLQCTVCHDKPGSKLLTNKGLYYQQLGSLQGYEQVVAFGDCASCHKRRPGSKKLTPTGRRFLAAVKDMKGLRLWLEQNHPGMLPPEPTPAAPAPAQPPR